MNSLRVSRAFSVSVAGMLATTIGLSTSAFASEPAKLAPDLMVTVATAPIQRVVNGGSDATIASRKSYTNGQYIRVIVRPVSTSKIVDRDVRVNLRKQVNRLGRVMPGTNAVIVEATPEQVLALSNDPTVASLSPDRPTTSATVTPDFNRVSVGVGAFPRGAGWYTGSGVGVAVLDSGVAPVSDIAPALLGWHDVINGQTQPYDDFGHGTHVAGIIAGNGQASSQAGATTRIAGVATGAKIISVKVLDHLGRGTVADTIAGIEWCIQNKAAYNIKVINLSMGGGVFESYNTDPLCQAAANAVAAGIVVVAAAGNTGGSYGAINSPANHPQVIAVGATNGQGTRVRSDDTVANFSSRGPSRFDLSIKPDIVAPGNAIASLRAPGSFIDVQYPQTRMAPSEYYGAGYTDGKESTYSRLTGTSMATPFVAGTVAIVLQANSGLTPNGVKAALMYSAQLLSGTDNVRGGVGPYDPLTQGAGLLNMHGAIAMANLMRPTGLTSSPSMVSTIAGQSVSWSGSAIPSLLARTNGNWADSLLASTTAPAWSGAALWTSGAAWSDGMVWANNLVWGGTTVWPPPPPTAIEPAINEDARWNGQALWGGPGSLQASNLFLGGAIEGMNITTGATSASNLVWGGTTVWPPPPPTLTEAETMSGESDSGNTGGTNTGDGEGGQGSGGENGR